LPSNKVGEPKHGSRYSHLVSKVLERYRDVITDELPKHLPPKKAVDHKIDLVLGAEPPTKAEPSWSYKNSRDNSTSCWKGAT
jgi:hypothetical protein